MNLIWLWQQNYCNWQKWVGEWGVGGGAVFIDIMFPKHCLPKWSGLLSCLIFWCFSFQSKILRSLFISFTTLFQSSDLLDSSNPCWYGRWWKTISDFPFVNTVLIMWIFPDCFRLDTELYSVSFEYLAVTRPPNTRHWPIKCLQVGTLRFSIFNILSTIIRHHKPHRTTQIEVGGKQQNAVPQIKYQHLKQNPSVNGRHF